MPDPRLVVAVALALAAVAAGSVLPWAGPARAIGPIEHLLYPAGSVVHYPQASNIEFAVPPEGGELVGAGETDHTSVAVGVVPSGAVLMCGTTPLNASSPYWGPGVRLSFHEELRPGEYWFGAFCFRMGNFTVTQPIEVVLP